MGLRSAFNPLGALPYESVELATITWDIDNIPKIGSISPDVISNYVLPTSWVIGDKTVAAQNVDFISSEADPNHQGYWKVSLSYMFDASEELAATITENDDNFEGSTGD